MILSNMLPILMALAMVLPLFGKSIIGITLGLCVILSIVILFTQKNNKEQIKAFISSVEVKAIILMFVLWGVSATQGIVPQTALFEATEFFAMTVGGMVIYGAVRSSEFSFDLFAKTICYGALLTASTMFLTPWINHYVGADLMWSSSYGSVLTILFPIVLIRLTRSPRNIILWVTMIMMCAAVFASGGRTAWVCLSTVSILFLFWMVFAPMARKLLIMAGLIVTMILGSWAGLQSYKTSAGDHIYNVRTMAMTKTERPASGRLTVWKNTWQHIEDNPVWGVGIKGSQQLYIEKLEGVYVRHIHNAILEIWTETGTVGLIAFLGTIFIFVGRFLMAYARTPQWNDNKYFATGVFFSCIAYGICSMALTSMFHAWWFLYLVVLLILLSVSRQQLSK